LENETKIEWYQKGGEAGIWGQEATGPKLKPQNLQKLNAKSHEQSKTTAAERIGGLREGLRASFVAEPGNLIENFVGPMQTSREWGVGVEKP